MNKYLIFFIIPLILMISSCSSINKTFINARKVFATEDINTSSCTLTLNVYASPDINNLVIKNDERIIDSKITYKKKDKFLIENDLVDATLYQFVITFKKAPLKISVINFYHNNNLYKTDIGKYEQIDLKKEHNMIKANVNIINHDVVIYIHNNLDRTIYLTNAYEIYGAGFIKFAKIISSETYLFPDTTKSYKRSKIVLPKEYDQISGFIKLEFTTNVKEYSTIAYYNYVRTYDVIKK